MSNLSDVTIAITSFLRPGYLYECLKGIVANLPECSVIVCDDSGDPNGILDVVRSCATVETPIETLFLPFDTGLTNKRNTILRATKTKYFLLACDDFDMSTPEARLGILKLVDTLDEASQYEPPVDVAVGRHGNNPYEGTLEYVPGKHIKEHRLQVTDPKSVHVIDIGVNYFMGFTNRMLPWDEAIGPIGGEHVDWFLDMKEAGRVVVWVPGVNINDQPNDTSKQDPKYGAMRGRCWDGHKLMKQKRGISKYIDFGGHIS